MIDIDPDEIPLRLTQYPELLKDGTLKVFSLSNRRFKWAPEVAELGIKTLAPADRMR